MRLIGALLSAMGAMALTRYDMQSESVTLGGNSLLRTSSDDLRFTDAYMNNAVQVRGDSPSNTVEWKVQVIHAGYYNIHFGFAIDNIALPVELDLYQDNFMVRGDHTGVQFKADSPHFGQKTETFEVYLYEGHHDIQLRGNPSKFTDTNIVSIDYLEVEAKPELPECVQRFDVGDAVITGGGIGVNAPRVGRYSLGWTGDGHLINFATLHGGVDAEGEEVSWPATVTWDDIAMEGPSGTLIFRYALQPEERDGIQLVSSEMSVKVNDLRSQTNTILQPTGDKRFFRESQSNQWTNSFRNSAVGNRLNSVSIESVDTRPGAHIDYLEIHDLSCESRIAREERAQFCLENPDHVDCQPFNFTPFLYALVVFAIIFLIAAIFEGYISN